MKKIEKGLITTIIIGIVFFLMRWPFASELIVISLGSLAIFYMYFGTFLFSDSSIKETFKKGGKKNFPKLFAGSVIGFVLAINIVGSTFTIMRWPFAKEMIIISLLLIVIFTIAGLILYKNKKDNFYKNVMNRLLLWALFSCLLLSLPKMFFFEISFKDCPKCIETERNFIKYPSDENNEKRMEAIKNFYKEREEISN